MFFMTEAVEEGEEAFMKLHENPFAKHIEHSGRLETIENVAKELKLEWLADKTKATEEQLMYVHTKEYIDIMNTTESLSLEELEKFPETHGFEDIYVNNYTFKAAVRAAGCGIKLVDTVLETGKIGFAGLRPPGHHAGPKEASGFCFFNNVAIAAKHIVKTHPEIERVLIVDWDVHCGQGTQDCIAGDDRIKLVNIFRHEYGAFWPYWKPGGIRPIEDKYRNTVNVPLNTTGFSNSDYLAIMQLIVFPLISDWKPQFIVVSCGFDAAFGDPEGDMTVTPLGFALMARLLAFFHPSIPLALFFEGGYFLPVVKESFRYVCKACSDQEELPLLQKQPLHPDLAPILHRIHEAFKEDFPLFDVLFKLVQRLKKLPSMEEIDKFIGRQPDVVEKDCCVVREEEIIEKLNKELEEINRKENPSGSDENKYSVKPVYVDILPELQSISLVETEKEIRIQVPSEGLKMLVQCTITLPLNPSSVPPLSYIVPSDSEIEIFADFIDSHYSHPALSHIPIAQICAK